MSYPDPFSNEERPEVPSVFTPLGPNPGPGQAPPPSGPPGAQPPPPPTTPPPTASPTPTPPATGVPLPPPVPPPPGYQQQGWGQQGYAQPGSGQPGYGQPGIPAYPGVQWAAPVAASPTNGVATAALVTGILGLVLAITCFFGLPFAVAAIVLGIIGIVRAGKLAGKGKGMAVAGLILGIVGIAAAVLMIVMIANSEGGGGYEDGYCDSSRVFDPDC